MTMLPPILAEVRTSAGQTFTELGKVRTEFAKTAASTEERSAAMTAAMQKTSKAVVTGFLGAAAVVTAVSVKMAADFERASVRLVTDAGESAKNLKMVESGMLDLSAATGTGAKEIASGMYIVESAGYHGAAGLQVMKAVAEGAKIGMADTKTVADALTTTLTDYGRAAGSPAQAMTMLTATVSTGKTNMEALAGSLHSVMPAAASAGISLKELLGAVGTMTAEGISADQATQNLNNAISNMMSPSLVAQKQMAQMGLSFIDVSQHLGQRGLTGTFQMLSDAITSHMGPDGLVIQSAMNQSKIAAQSARTEMAQMPPAMQKMAQAFLDNKITQKEWVASLKDLPIQTANLGRQFAVTEKRAAGFGDLLKSGGGVAQTYNAAMQKMTGGMTGLQVALHLTGDHMPAFQENVKKIGAASVESGGHVAGWAETQKTLTVQMQQAGASIQVMAIKLGTFLMPYVKEILKVTSQWTSYLTSHKAVLIAIIAVIGTVVGSMAAYYVGTKLAAAAMVIWRAAVVAGNVVAGLFGLTTAASTAATYGSVGATYASGAAMRAYAIGAGIARGATIAWTAATKLGTEIQKGAQVMMWLMKASTLQYLGSLLLTKAAMIGGAVATGIATAAQWAWNTALTANPIGIVIAAIAALVAGLVWFFTQTKLGQQIWHNFSAFIGTAIKAIGAFFSWLWKNSIQPAFNGIAAVVGWFWQFFSAIFRLIGAIIEKTVAPVFTWLQKNVIEPVFNGIAFAVKFGALVLQTEFAGIVQAVKAVGGFFTWLWQNVVEPAWNGIVFAVKWATGIMSTAFAFVHNYIVATLGPVFNWLWKSVIEPVWTGISNAIKWAWDYVISPPLNALHDFINNKLPAAFKVFQQIAGGVWDTIKSAATAPIKFVIDTVYNNGIVKAFNAAADFFEGGSAHATHLPAISLPAGLAGGGVVPGYQSARRDDILMPMRRGEGVLVPEVVRALGPGFVHRLNAAGNSGGVGGVRKAVGLAGGGIVGDILGNIGGFVSSAIGDIGSFVSNPLGGLQNVVNGLMKSFPGGAGILKVVQGFGSKVIGDVVKGIQSLFGANQSSGGGSKGNPTGSGVNQWAPYVVSALAANGLSTSSDMVSKVLRQIATESGGNPKAVQNGYVDVNTLSGDLAKGLMQTISATFNHYAFPGHGDIFNGYDNLLAALNYAKHAYGSNLSALGNGHGYKHGGWVPGPTGSPVESTNHGGEYMLSVDMLAGRKRVDPTVARAVLQNQAAFSSASVGTARPGTSGMNVTINARTNARPEEIAAEFGWWLRRNGG